MKVEGGTAILFTLADAGVPANLAKEKQKDRIEQVVVATIAHELSTPLSGIIGMIELLQSRITDVDLLRFCRVAMNTAKLLINMINDVTDFSQIKAGKLRITITGVDVREIIDECKEWLDLMFSKRNVQLNTQVAHNVPANFFTDRNKYRQILLNLMGNAAKFTFQGTVEVSVTYDGITKILTTTVIDTGLGISEETRKRLFKLYTKKSEGADDATAPSAGLGLVICKKLSVALGGDIGVESVEGDGSKFTFHILNKENQKNEQVVKSTLMHISLHIPSALLKSDDYGRIADEERGGGELGRSRAGSGTAFNPRSMIIEREEAEKKCDCAKVLIVDDNEYNIFVLQTMLKSVGIASATAYNGQLAIRLVDERFRQRCCHRYELILMDINMPVMGGVQAAKVLTEQMKRNVAGLSPVVGLASESSRETEMMCYRAGMSSISIVKFQ